MPNTAFEMIEEYHDDDDEGDDYDDNHHEDDEDDDSYDNYHRSIFALPKLRMTVMITIIVASSALPRVPSDDHDYASLSKRHLASDAICVIEIWSPALMIIITAHHSQHLWQS